MLSGRLLIFTCLVFLTSFGLSQEQNFRVIVSKDSMSIKDIVQIEFIIENIEGQFIPPTFKDFVILGGPNTMSSMSIINGEMTQKKSYTFVIRPRSEGEITIESAQIKSKNKTYETEPIKVFITEEKSDHKSNIIEKNYKSPHQDNPKPKNPRAIKRI